MGEVTYKTKGGKDWVPSYLTEIDDELCIGCGRCFKVCGHGVLEMMGINEDGEMVDPYDEDEEIERKVMIVKDDENCIGCEACSTVCGTNAQTHESMQA
ncbi:MAG: ferredoxin III, nif-specific [Rhodospirillaceae bacterium]